MQGELAQVEVTVIGGGLAGMAASLHLAKAGLDVMCIEPDSEISKAVGESLDWSSPELLGSLGFPMARLIGEGIATYKRHVTVNLDDGCTRQYFPSDWLGRRPFHIELRTLHVDRLRLHRELRAVILSHGVRLLRDKVADVERDGRHVVSVTTAQGERICSPLFIDASGAATSLFPRAFNLPFCEYGPQKVAIWNHFDVPESIEGTTLYTFGARNQYMEWIWEIPIRPDAISVGFVAPGDVIKSMRQQGKSVEDIFREHLGHFPRLQRLLDSVDAISPMVTSYQCGAYRKVTGPNWLVIGEAASMIDPMTSNGVTAALRQAEEAAGLLLKNRGRRHLPRLAAALYSRRVFDLGRFFNSGIEKVVYDWPIRERIGTLNAGDVYTVPAWSLNHVYSRVRPQGLISTLFITLLLNLFRASAEIYHAFCMRMRMIRTRPVAG